MKSILFNSPKKQAGLSLVELMVALLISTILLLGVLELFGSSSKTSRSANAVARLQENSRLVMDLIAREARRTGFNGCDAGLGDSGRFDAGAGGAISNFPEESLTGSTDKSLIFRYFGSNDGTVSNSCNRTDLSEYYIQFSNCSSGQDICVTSGSTGHSSPVLLNHATIEKIHYIQPCDPPNVDKTCTYGTPPTKPGTQEISFAKVQKIQVQLKLCTDTLSEQNTKYCAQDSDTKITRTFSSLIELRNQL